MARRSSRGAGGWPRRRPRRSPAVGAELRRPALSLLRPTGQRAIRRSPWQGECSRAAAREGRALGPGRGGD
nr:unnamed protein product [Digitaria exilis]